MGVYYYLVNHTKKQYAGHFGKSGEFDSEVESMLLNWDYHNDDIREINEHDYHESIMMESADGEIKYYNYVEESPAAVNLKIYRSVYNLTKNEYYNNQNEEPKILTENADLFTVTGWQKDDQLIYCTYTSYYYPNVDRSIFEKFFYGSRDEYKLVGGKI